MHAQPDPLIVVTEAVRVAQQLLAAYGGLGVLVAAALHWRGLGMLDEGTRGAGIGFRLLITPGLVALWPLIAWRWWRMASRGEPSIVPQDSEIAVRRLRFAHGLLWKGIGLGVPIIVVAALGWRSSGESAAKLSAHRLFPGPVGVAVPPR